MSIDENVFIPYACCTVSSGECFNQARCLDQCKKLQKVDHEKRLKELERKFVNLQLDMIDLQRKLKP